MKNAKSVGELADPEIQAERHAGRPLRRKKPKRFGFLGSGPEGIVDSPEDVCRYTGMSTQTIALDSEVYETLANLKRSVFNPKHPVFQPHSRTQVDLVLKRKGPTMPAGFSVLTLALAALASPAGAQAPARGPEANRLPAPLRAGLVLYYPFTDGTSDGVTDASGRGHAGKLQGGACVPAGRRGPALRFQDKAEITTPHAASLAFAESNSFTVAVWAWPDAASGDWQGVVVQSRLKPPFYGLYLEPGRKWVVYTGPLKGPAAEARWQHLALVQDGAAGKRRLYVDGRQVAEGPSQDSSGPGGLNVGSGGGGYAHFQGMLDELCIYKRALPETELRALMTATTDAGQAPASTTGQ